MDVAINYNKPRKIGHFFLIFLHGESIPYKAPKEIAFFIAK